MSAHPPVPRSISSHVARLFRSRWFPLVLVAAAGLLTAAVAAWAFPHHSWNRDELTYLWHADVLRSGHLAATDGGSPDLFRPFLTALGDGTIFSQYSLGWPVAILLGGLVGAPQLALWASTSLVLLGTRALALEIGEDRVVAAVASLAMLGAPIVVLHSGMYLNYLFTLGLALYFATSVISGMRRGSWPRIALGGVLLGWIFLTRPYDALVWALVVGVHVLLTEILPASADDRRRRLLLTLVGVAAVLPFVGAQLWMNQRLTGSPLEFPMAAKDPLDTFGFGERRIMPAFPTVDYTLGMAVASFARNAFWMPFFLAGAHVAGVIAAIAVWRRRREEATWFLVAIGAAFPITYFVFWGSHVSAMIARLTGPIYLIPAYVPLSILVAHQLVVLHRRRPRVALGLAGTLVLISLVLGGNRLALNRDLSLAQAPWAAAEDQLEGPTIVIVSSAEYLLYLNPYGSNSPLLDDEVLYVADFGTELIDLIAAHPDRVVVQQEASLSEANLIPSETPTVPEITFRPVEVSAAPVLEWRVRIAATDSPVVVAYLTSEHGTIHRTLSTDARPGDVFETVWRVAPGSSDDDLGGAPLDGELHVGVGFGATEDEARSMPAYQHRNWVRTGDRTVTAVLPGRTFEMADDATGADPNWLETGIVSELEVEVVPATR